MTPEATATEELAAPVEARPSKAKPKRPAKPQRQPRYQVVLWNDEDHTFTYVIRMLKQLFGRTVTEGFKIAREVHQQGRAVVLVTTREHAELKRDQIHAFGPDRLVDGCAGSMWATIEPVPSGT